MRFDWDPDKALANEQKHGVRFEEAIEVFQDPNLQETADDEHSEDELRQYVVGLSSRRLLFVVHSFRDGDVIRILSARKANAREKRMYAKATHED